MATPHSDFSGINQTRSALAIFCRAPQLGRVKTRLAVSRDDAFALALYRAMLRDTFDGARALAPQTESFACHTPADAFDTSQGSSELGALWSGATLAQHGDDLGARMLNALADLRARGFERVAVIGSDAPDVPPAVSRHAFARLNQVDVVVGPSFDGGFYFLGASCDPPAAIFAGIEWSRDTVLARLIQNLESCGLNYERLAIWRDVDEVADLEALRERLQRGETSAPATRNFLFNHKEHKEHKEHKKQKDDEALA